jgi:hypothetical protein
VKEQQANRNVLECTLSVSEIASSDGSCMFRVVLVNRSSGILNLGLQGLPPARFSVETRSGERLWESTYGEAIQQVLELRTLAPSDSLVYTCRWNLAGNNGVRLPQGDYLVRGWIELDAPYSAHAGPVAVRIP